MPLPTLPFELWLVIFRWATISKATRFLFTVTYSPFLIGVTDDIDREAAAIKLALGSVCKHWRHAVTSLLLEDVVIHNDLGVLKYPPANQALRSGHDSVRRVCLPYTSCLSYRSDANKAATLLANLSRLEVLVRPPPSQVEELRFEFPAEDCPPLPSLRRLDWWQHSDAYRTGGLNSLTDVLRAASNVEYLSLGGEMCMGFLHQAPITLPSLTTLRMRPVNAPHLLPFRKWNLPMLKHIIVDTYNGIIPDNFWSTFGSQVETAELGQSVNFCLVDMIQYVLSVCSNLKELNYYLQFTAIPCLPKPHTALTTMRLHAAENNLFADEGNGFWEHIAGHFATISTRFPALEHVVLHGDWTHLLRDNRFQAIIHQVVNAGRHVEFSE